MHEAHEHEHQIVHEQGERDRRHSRVAAATGRGRDDPEHERRIDAIENSPMMPVVSDSVRSGTSAVRTSGRIAPSAASTKAAIPSAGLCRAVAGKRGVAEAGVLATPSAGMRTR